MSEEWETILDFPKYEISNTGLVIHKGSSRPVKTSRTMQGAIKVGLVDDSGIQRTRSVKVLVAKAFVSGHTDIFNTPVQLDGDQENVEATNLVWRPKSFAWKYTRQFEEQEEYWYKGPVIESVQKDVYTSVYDVGIINGLLFWDVLVSCYHHQPVFPTWQQFRFL